MSAMSHSFCILANILKKEQYSDTVVSAKICSEFYATYVAYKLVLESKKLWERESHPQRFFFHV
jgi:hypothetical protein